VDSRERKIRVTLSLKGHEELFGDLHELVVVAERRDGDTASLEEMRQRLERGLRGHRLPE
jgi:hypothetical protein